MKVTRLKNRLKEKDIKLLQATTNKEYNKVVVEVDEIRRQIELELSGGDSNNG